MKPAKLLCTGVFAAALTAAGVTARADIITLDVSATLTAVLVVPLALGHVPLAATL